MTRTELRRIVFERDGFVCGICGGPMTERTRVIDHIIPRCMGGSDAMGNLRAVHGFCNNSRGPHRNWHTGSVVLRSDKETSDGMRIAIGLGQRLVSGELV
jgi:5-methylcytosine-specific restriction endonuclease McrA